MLLGLQLVLPAGTPPAQAPGLAARRLRPVTVAPLADFAAILAAPLFAPDRHPGASASLTDTGGGSLAGYAALGAASGRAVATAVMAVPGGGVKTVRRGDDLEGWRLVAIDRTRVIFERKGARHALIIGAPPESGQTPAGDTETQGPAQ